MKGMPTTFFSSVAELGSDGGVVIGLFDGDGTAVGLLSCSAEAALSLIENIAACLRSDLTPQEGLDA